MQRKKPDLNHVGRRQTLYPSSLKVIRCLIAENHLEMPSINNMAFSWCTFAAAVVIQWFFRCFLMWEPKKFRLFYLKISEMLVVLEEKVFCFSVCFLTSASEHCVKKPHARSVRSIKPVLTTTQLMIWLMERLPHLRMDRFVFDFFSLFMARNYEMSP